MEKVEIKEESTKSSRMVGYLAAAVALLAVAFIVMIACSTYLIENKECEESSPKALAPMEDAENCDSFHYEGKIGNTTYSEHTTVCESTKTEFGIVRDTKTGFVMNSFFTDYIEEVEVVYMAKSHRCLLTNDMGTDDFDADLESFRNDNYQQGPYEYSIGNQIRSWDAIPQSMRGYCSPQNTYEWLKHGPEEDDHHSRDKRHGIHLCCCFFIYAGSWWVSWACGTNIDSCTFGSNCLAYVAGHWDTCSITFQECVDAYNFYG